MFRLPFASWPSRANSPDAGSTRLSIARASVDLPQPDSPTTPRISPWRHSNETPSTARATLALDAELHRQVANLHQGLGIHSATSAAVTAGAAISGHSLQGAKWHAAACPGPTSRSAGSSKQRSAAYGQRGRKRQPSGRLARVGRATRDRRREAALAADHRQRLEQPLRVRVLRGVEDGAHRAGLDDPARVHDRDPVAGLGEHAEVVRDQDQRQPELLAQALEQLQHLRLHDHVERGRRLVGDHQRRPAGQREGDHHPLALAAGELVGVAAPERRRQPDGLEQLVDPPAHLVRARRAARAGGSPRRSGPRPAAPGRASSSRPGRRARCGASGRSASRSRSAGRG